MKKYIPAVIFLVVFLFISLLYTPLYFDKYLAKSKNITSIIEMDHYIEDPKMLKPTYDMDQNNPYSHVASEAMSLERSDQYGEWDGYHIIITPNKLSDSTCFTISISCRSSDLDKTSDLSWSKRNVTTDIITGENYPEGKYTRYMGTFHQDAYTYEITGFVFGLIDDNRDKEILEELEYLIDGLE